MSEPETASPQPDGVAANELTALRTRADAAEKQRDEFKDMLRRTQADFENYQKRSQRDLQQERRYWNTPLALDLVTALDNLDRATAAARQAGDTGPLAQGVALVLGQLQDVLKRHGITPIEALGQPFDPNKHEAVMQRPSADHPPGTVLDVFARGYMIHDRVLRPATVVVSAAAP